MSPIHPQHILNNIHTVFFCPCQKFKILFSPTVNIHTNSFIYIKYLKWTIMRIVVNDSACWDNTAGCSVLFCPHSLGTQKLRFRRQKYFSCVSQNRMLYVKLNTLDSAWHRWHTCCNWKLNKRLRDEALIQNTFIMMQFECYLMLMNALLM